MIAFVTFLIAGCLAFILKLLLNPFFAEILNIFYLSDDLDLKIKSTISWHTHISTILEGDLKKNIKV